MKTERLSDGHPVMCRRRFTISAQSIVLQRKHTWKSVTTLISGRVMQRWSAPIFMMRFYSPVILILNAVVVAVVMLLSASGNHTVLTFFGMSAGTAVAVINYISQIFSPVESLGMEIQTIQSAIAGIHRINEFLHLRRSR